MARPQKCRKVCCEPEYCKFLPDGFPSDESVVLNVDEYEVIRLIDLENLDQSQCAKQIGVARTTVTQIYDVARKKIADSIVNGKTLKIKGGSYCLPSLTKNTNIIPKGELVMRIAVTFENDLVFQHFGHTSFFKFYDVENKKIVTQKVVSTNGKGHGALAEFLASNNVDTLICGGIGGGAQMALSNANIKLFGGVSGKADEVVQAFIDGNLNFNPNVKCNHHGNGEHTCGEHGCSHN